MFVNTDYILAIENKNISIFSCDFLISYKPNYIKKIIIIFWWFYIIYILFYEESVIFCYYKLLPCGFYNDFVTVYKK